MPGRVAVEGPEEVRRKAFHETAVMMKRRVDIMLPLEGLDRLSLQKQVREIPTHDR